MKTLNYRNLQPLYISVAARAAALKRLNFARVRMYVIKVAESGFCKTGAQPEVEECGGGFGGFFGDVLACVGEEAVAGEGVEHRAGARTQWMWNAKPSSVRVPMGAPNTTTHRGTPGQPRL